MVTGGESVVFLDVGETRLKGGLRRSSTPPYQVSNLMQDELRRVGDQNAKDLVEKGEGRPPAMYSHLIPKAW